ncbi:TonB family protein [Myxococcus landrumensis]|uniref:TonB family protein n=2 Tax=Myxococcus landrumensis TaxID=2813577 RepID=A0ABX7NAD6_9BACT|nr:TonB family protein [Myxococcus landrumus]
MKVRMILNFDLPALESERPVEPRVAPSTGLFRMGEAVEPEGLWARWGWALITAVVVHAGVVAAGMAMPASARERPPAPEEPELVLLAFAPPPPAPSSGAARSVPVERAARPSRPRVARPVVETPIQPQPKPEVIEPPVDETPPVADDAPSTPDAVADAPADSGPAPSVTGGVVGGSVGGTQGGIVGATGMLGDAVGLGQVLRPPTVLKQPRPDYPRRAKSEGIQGLVLVRIIVGTDGEVEAEHTRVLRSIPTLDAAAIEAVNRWRFTPAIGRQGKPVRVILELPIQFTLK